jgi:hypothetical protein
MLRTAGALVAGGRAYSVCDAAAASEHLQSKQTYFQRFPTLFAPFYGEATKETLLRQVGDGIWAVEQNLEIGPLQTPLRCVVVRLRDGSLWVHAPLAPTEEFFELVEACGNGSPDCVAHVVAPTYALEHKVFVKDALKRWPRARLWTSPGQFSFPVQVPDDVVWGKEVSGVLDGSDIDLAPPTIPWSDEIRRATGTSTPFTPGFVVVDAWDACGNVERGDTWSTANPLVPRRAVHPTRRLDYSTPTCPRRRNYGSFQSCVLAGVGAIDGVQPSDHYAVLAEVQL